jgi:hypothetical protein
VLYGHRIFQRYRELDPKRIPQVMTGNESHTLTVSVERVEKMPELKVTPLFSHREHLSDSGEAGKSVQAQDMRSFLT